MEEQERQASREMHHQVNTKQVEKTDDGGEKRNEDGVGASCKTH